MDKKLLIKKALEAREKAYAPYSRFAVGAALLTRNGEIYQGCNIESVSFTPTVCAERTAIYKAVSEGEREFEAIAVVGGPIGQEPSKPSSAPCGVCRQVMLEFNKELKIIIAKSEEDFIETTLVEVLPLGFGPEALQGQDE
jgi:cytidine deaminase